MQHLRAGLFLVMALVAGCAGSSSHPVAPMERGGAGTPKTDDGSPTGDPSSTTATTAEDICAPLREQKLETAAHFEDLAICEESVHHYVDALRDAQKAMEHGIRERNAGIMQTSRARLKSLLERIPHVTFKLEDADTMTDVHVMFDGRDVPLDALDKKFSVDPGKHIVEAVGVRAHTNGTRRGVRHQSVIDIPESELVAIRIALR